MIYLNMYHLIPHTTPTMWKQFSVKLNKHEKIHNMKQTKIKCIDAPEYGKGVKAYTVFYEKPGIKQGREFKNGLNKVWNSLDNPLSSKWK